MSLYEFQGHAPKIGKGCFIAPSAQVIGQVHMGDHSNLWFQTVARGDINLITIGEYTNVQDLTMLHIDYNLPLTLGSYVSVGHNAVLHACTVEDRCLIGMGAIVLDNAVIGKNSMVAAGSLVPPGKKYPPGSMIMGSPARVVRDLTPEELDKYGNHYKTYIKHKDNYLRSFKKVD